MTQFLDEQEKLKELTGDSRLNNQLIEVLKSNGIDLEYGHNIQKTLESEIKHSKLGVNDIEPRLNYLIDQLSTITNEEEIKNIVEITSSSQRTLKFLINQSHNINVCPECGARYLKTDIYCYKCGLKLNDSDDELSELEKLYNKKISHLCDNKFKYAYVVYLDYVNENKILKRDLYNISLNQLELKAIEDGFIIDSGISAAGENFINDNRHVLFYYNHVELRNVINIDLYEDLFENKSVRSRNRIIHIVIDYLKKQEMITISNYEVVKCRAILCILSKYYESVDDIHQSVENYFKIFMIDLNNFCEDLKQAQPYCSSLNERLINKLIDLLDANSVDIDTLKKINQNSYDSIKKLNPQIGADESLIYFLRIFNGEKISDVEKSIHLKYSS